MNKKILGLAAIFGVGAWLTVSYVTHRSSVPTETPPNSAQNVPSENKSPDPLQATPPADDKTSAPNAPVAKNKSDSKHGGGFFGFLGGKSTEPVTAENSGVTPKLGEVPSGLNPGVGVGVGSTVAGAGGSASSTAPTTPVVPVPPKPEVIPEPMGCNKLTYVSKVSPQKYEKNSVHLPEALQDGKTKWESLCVRVDNVPVKFDFNRVKLEVTFGGVKRPDSRVSLSYCRGDAKCGDACVVPHDEFMEALAGGQEEEQEAANVKGWQDDAARTTASEDEVEKEISSFNKALGDERIKATNSAWNADGKAQACESRVAKLP